jgi:hypothetical protein
MTTDSKSVEERAPDRPAPDQSPAWASDECVEAVKRAAEETYRAGLAWEIVARAAIAACAPFVAKHISNKEGLARLQGLITATQESRAARTAAVLRRAKED